MYSFHMGIYRLQNHDACPFPIDWTGTGNQQTVSTSNITSINCICNHIEHNSSRYIKVYTYIYIRGDY